MKNKHWAETFLRAQKTPGTQGFPSNPLTTSVREGHHGGAWELCMRGVSCSPSFLLSSPASPQWIQTSAHVEGVSRWEHVSRSAATRGGISKFVSSLVTNHKPHQGPLFPTPFPSWDYSHLLFLTSLFSPRYGKSESLFQYISLWGWWRGGLPRWCEWWRICLPMWDSREMRVQPLAWEDLLE